MAGIYMGELNGAKEKASEDNREEAESMKKRKKKIYLWKTTEPRRRCADPSRISSDDVPSGKKRQWGNTSTNSNAKKSRGANASANSKAKKPRKRNAHEGGC